LQVLYLREGTESARRRGRRRYRLVDDHRSRRVLCWRGWTPCRSPWGTRKVPGCHAQCSGAAGLDCQWTTTRGVGSIEGVTPCKQGFIPCPGSRGDFSWILRPSGDGQMNGVYPICNLYLVYDHRTNVSDSSLAPPRSGPPPPSQRPHPPPTPAPAPRLPCA